MCLLFETIKIKNGIIFHSELHQARIDRSITKLFKRESNINLTAVLSKQKFPSDDWIKCKVVYDTEVKEVTFHPYTPKKIKSLKIIENNEIEYSLKYANRRIINMLYEQRELNDDIIIVRNGFVTDSSYANLVFWDGHNWHTPNSPLLKGVQRQFLLSQCKIIESQIKIEDLVKYKKAGLINAMLDITDMPTIGIKKVNPGSN